MTQKFLTNSNGDLAEKAGTSISGGVANAGDLVSLGTDGKLDSSVLPNAVGTPSQAILASEALAAGDFVNIWNNAGAFNVRKADASAAGKRAHGYVLAAVASGANAVVYFDDINSQLTGLTPGEYFLSDTTPGAATLTIPTTATHIVQRLGKAISASAIDIEIATPIILA